jgi:hypothetical protein
MTVRSDIVEAICNLTNSRYGWELNQIRVEAQYGPDRDAICLVVDSSPETPEVESGVIEVVYLDHCQGSDLEGLKNLGRTSLERARELSMDFEEVKSYFAERILNASTPLALEQEWDSLGEFFDRMEVGNNSALPNSQTDEFYDPTKDHERMNQIQEDAAALRALID